MTRKHFEAIAHIILTTEMSKKERMKSAERYADYFATVNPNFKRVLFIKAATGIIKL